MLVVTAHTLDLSAGGVITELLDARIFSVFRPSEKQLTGVFFREPTAILLEMFTVPPDEWTTDSRES
jgi:hypothetical protein